MGIVSAFSLVFLIRNAILKCLNVFKEKENIFLVKVVKKLWRSDNYLGGSDKYSLKNWRNFDFRIKMANLTILILWISII